MKIKFLRFNKFIFSILFFFAIFCRNSVAQIAENQIITDPYQTLVFIPGQSPGGIGISFFDSMPHFYNNPAGLSSIHRYSLFLSSSITQEQIKFIHQKKSFLKSEDHSTTFASGLFAFALPFHLFHRSVTVATSFNTEIPYDYQLQKDILGRAIDYSGHLKTMKVELGIDISPTMSIGGGLTRWFGERKAIFTDPLRRNETSQKSSGYNGESFYAGARNIITDKISLNTVFYFPFQLKIDYHEKNRGKNILNSELNHEFAGAVQVGLNYKLGSSNRIGLGYFYQRRFAIKTSTNSDEIGEKYNPMQSFSIGVGHQFTIWRKALPVYLVYRKTRPAYAESGSVIPPQLTEMNDSQSDRKLTAQILELGGSTKFRYITAFLNVRWQITGKYKQYPSALT